ncbi:Ti-type conjugative transfer relaxase TraA [Caulobacter rhizosphaerae]|jgi:Ti-type conjugative transfer relaxase TraA|uniref:Ti-type conjugative transfer relaxase TraA n=1 Tax=Caulobacter rhizosphaerae TaxID=2010972 RepID=UPI0013D5435A|nr:Ti-type conjugative transfer relaxase TraA [Caulobacter rhizosphaerae]GGL18520.1 hypothetical protein GCM10010983_14720 [Caulobacter rhizosphaerae]
MAMYHLAVKIIGRAKGSRAVSAAAYRAGARLYDEGLCKIHDFTRKQHVVHSEIIAPCAAARRAWPGQAHLWNAVEAAEKHKNAQLAREVVVAIPPELGQQRGIVLVRDWVRRTFVDQGMIADLNVHWDVAGDGKANPHAHIMLTMRRVVETPGSVSFGLKAREWNKPSFLMNWRQTWAEQVNESLARANVDARIDHRSYRAQGIWLDPQRHLGRAALEADRRGRPSAKVQAYRDTARRNGERLMAHPEIGLAAITHQQATFTANDLARFAHYHSDSKAQFDGVLSALRQSPALVALGRDARGDERYTSLDMLGVEQRLDDAAAMMARMRSHAVNPGFVAEALLAARHDGLTLSKEQRAAVDFMTRPSALSTVVGYAGAGKGVALGVARRAWAAQGYRVQGAALSGIAAENLQEAAAIPSRTLASLEQAWSQGRDGLTERDVLVIDEAGLVGSRQMQSVFDHALRAGAKIVLVGDVEQLQAIQAGAAFRLIAQRHGAAEITKIRRQLQSWQAAATLAMADGRTEAALDAYRDAGHVHAHEDSQAAQDAMIARWAADRQSHPSHSQLLLAHGRDEAQRLNQSARLQLKAEGALGPDHRIATAEGERLFAVGDRVFFRRNARELGVKNGTAATIAGIQDMTLKARLDDGRLVAVDLTVYDHLDHGYATTVHRAQGVTVDRVYFLASQGADRHAAYVALSRHRHAVWLHYGRDQFSSYGDLARSLGRDRPKDMALDYMGLLADHRDQVRSPLSGEPRTFGRARSDVQRIDAHPHVTRLLERYAAIVLDLQRSHRQDMDLARARRGDLEQVTKAIMQLWPGAAHDLARVIEKNPGLLGWAAQGRGEAAAAALVAHRDRTRASAADGVALSVHPPGTGATPRSARRRERSLSPQAP